MKQRDITLRPYDSDVAEDVFNVLFYGTDTTEDGLVEIPSASYQLVASALELIQVETYGDDWDAIRRARAIVERLRDKQKIREKDFSRTVSIPATD